MSDKVTAVFEYALKVLSRKEDLKDARYVLCHLRSSVFFLLGAVLFIYFSLYDLAGLIQMSNGKLMLTVFHIFSQAWCIIYNLGMLTISSF